MTALALASAAPLPALATEASARPLFTLQPSAGPVIRFVAEPPAAVLAPLPVDPSMTLLSLPGFESDGVVGAPALPARIVQVAVPPAGEVRVSATATAPEVLEGLLLAPQPARAGEGGDTPSFERDPAAYAAPGAPGPRARLVGVSWLRDQRVASVAVVPADYDPVSRRLTLWRRIEVEVTVTGDLRATTPRVAIDPFEPVYRGALLNYEQGRAWRRPESEPRGAGRALGARAPGPALDGSETVPDTSIYVGRDWVKIAIRRSGFYRINFGQLRNRGVFGGDVTTAHDAVRLFTWPGVPVLPEESYCDSCDYREVAIEFLDDDTVLNQNSDEIHFYALGPNDWASVYDPARPETLFVNHPYDTKNYYYLGRSTVDAPFPGAPKRITSRSGLVAVDGDERVPSNFPSRTHYEVDGSTYLPDASPKAFPTLSLPPWEKFFWTSLNLGQSFPIPLSEPGIDTSAPATLRAHVWGITLERVCSAPFTHQVELRVDGTPLPVREFAGFAQNPRPFIYQQDAVLQPGSTVELRYLAEAACPGKIGRLALAWLDVFSRRRFIPVGDSLAFESDALGGPVIYRIGPFTGGQQPSVFDVTDPLAPVRILDVSWIPGAGGDTLVFEAVEAGRHRYRIMPGFTPVSDADIGDAPAASLENLRSATRGADYLILYYDGFQQAAETLRAWRTDQLSIGTPGPHEVVALPISALWDQFSGGRVDPSAIRNLLRAAFFNWRTRPAYVTFLGDASYDFKNILGRAPAGQPGALVPSYENGFALGRTFATDDWLLNVDDATRVVPDFLSGRLPVGDASSASFVVDRRIVDYERSAPFGAWRNRVMLIGDDNKQADSPDPLRWQHVSQTAFLDTLIFPRHLDRRYVYLHKYPDGPGFTKPLAKTDIRANVNNGVLLFNYVGHGSPFQLADEKVLLDVDAGTFDNAQQLTLFVAASCDVGKFNDPVVLSLGERMLLAPNGGSVAVISATEIAYSNLNADLANEFYRALFRRSANGRYESTLGAALLAAKLVTGTGLFQIANNQKYQVMGDGAITLDLPRRWAEVSLHPCDTCATVLTEMPRGQQVSFRGRVLDGPGGAPVALEGTADLLIEDSLPVEVVNDPEGCVPPNCTSYRYWYSPGPVFRGDARISGGTFAGNFIVPLEAKGGPYGRLRAYVKGREAGMTADEDGVGSAQVQVSQGTPAGGDVSGPEILLSFAGGATAVRPDATLRIDLFDPSGILITGHNPQNGIVVTVDDNPNQRVDITSTFRYLAGSFQSGTATFQLPNLAPGTHRIEVSAADNLAAGLTAAQHRSSASIDFVVADVPPLDIVRAYLFPNPVRSAGAGSGGQFVIDARGDSLNALIRVYTVTGRLVRTLKAFGGIDQVQVPWDGRDHEGDPLANGTYLFRVQINTRQEDGRSSPRQKSVAEGRFVVINP